ncbi:uncharacterized protein BJ212DRAFT_1354930 [Suillus subaureus]|uniref:Uncharacterized protein n=1 Tax=Suillus subaureus TaxID=48587 RepID=A0A9P7EB08_9AGAM|nr:uncharacterized protein BJ212DRAFT_1354930 [Suillus subaureus]KAG1816467.1 hypothetical protein BJ212DRAFT_1354930 [Suillus subaureus]
MKYRTPFELQEQPGTLGIVLVVTYEVAIIAKRMPTDVTTIAKAVDSMPPSTILLLFQSARVLSTNKLSEQVSDIWLKHE